MLVFNKATLEVNKELYRFPRVELHFDPIKIVCIYPEGADFKIKTGHHNIILDGVFAFEKYKSRNYKDRVIFKNAQIL